MKSGHKSRAFISGGIILTAVIIRFTAYGFLFFQKLILIINLALRIAVRAWGKKIQKNIEKLKMQ